MSTVFSPFSSQLIMTNSAFMLIVFHQFLTWIARGNVDLHFLLILVIKSYAF